MKKLNQIKFNYHFYFSWKIFGSQNHKIRTYFKGKPLNCKDVTSVGKVV